MEKKKPTIDEIYKLNVDGLFESTANWFDSAYQKSQAEINKDLYNRINNYTSSGESTGGNVNLGGLLTSLNNSNLYPSKGYLYYNGDSWEFNTPIGGGGGVVDTAAIKKIVNDTINNVSWWGQKINNNKVDGSIVITKGTHSFTIELDNDGNLKFNGNVYATGGVTALGAGTTSGGGSGASLGTLLTKLNSDNPFPTANGQVLTYDGSNFIWKIPTGSGGSGVTLSPVMSQMNKYLTKTTLNTPQFLYWNGTTYTWKNESEISGGGGSIQVAQTPEYAGGSENWVSTTKLRFVGITGTKPTIRTNSEKSCVDVGIPIGGGSGSSGTTSGKLRFYKDSSEESWNGESDFKIIFGSGLNVTWDSHSQITLSATGGSSTGGSVDLSSYLTKTDAASTYAPKSHSHIASDITNFVSSVKAVKVNNAILADKANELNSPVTLWGNNFYGSNNINGNIQMGTAGGDSIQLWMNNGNMLDRTNNTLHIGYGLKESSDGEIYLDAYRTVVYTDNMSRHYDFKSNVFDVNTNAIHFGSGASGGKISWDTANNAFKIEGNVYATGGITALGVSNSATTSNNVDFTFKSVTANTFDVMNSIRLSDSLSLVKYGKDVYLSSDDGSSHNIYLDGNDKNYYLSSDGDAFFYNFTCDSSLNFSGVTSFEITDITDTGFNIQFVYNGKTYKFFPSDNSITVS